MTPEAQARFYKALYRAKCEQYDAVMKEVDLLLQPADETPRLGTLCGCKRYTFARSWEKFEEGGITHRPNQHCYRTVTGP